MIQISEKTNVPQEMKEYYWSLETTEKNQCYSLSITKIQGYNSTITLQFFYYIYYGFVTCDSIPANPTIRSRLANSSLL
jgi:hypothetical protein